MPILRHRSSLDFNPANRQRRRPYLDGCVLWHSDMPQDFQRAKPGSDSAADCAATRIHAAISGSQGASPVSKPFTVIIQNYYEERQKYWPQIFQAIHESSVQPEEVIIWDNMGASEEFDPSLDSFCVALRASPIKYDPKNLTIMSSSRNTLLGRYAAALIAKTPYVFFQDNDLLVNPDTIKTLLDAITGECQIVGPSGLTLLRKSATPYTHGLWATGGVCDVILGRCFACHRRALWPGIELVFDGIDPGRADDILFNLAALEMPRVVPAAYTNLDEQGVGLSHEPEHFAERDAMARKLLDMGY